MPRPRNEQNEASRTATENWRARRKDNGRPESSIVDRAVAGAVAAFLSETLFADQAAPEPTLRDIVKGAQRLLIDRGYGELQSNQELRRRLTRRSDIFQLIDTAITSAKVR